MSYANLDDLPDDVRDMLGMHEPLSPERKAKAIEFATKFKSLKAEYDARALSDENRQELS